MKASISDKKVSTKMEPAKDFGSFSALLAPSLLTGKTTAASFDEETSSNRMTSNKLSTSNLSTSNKLSATNLSTSNLSTSNLSTSKLSQLKSDKKEEMFDYSSSFQDKFQFQDKFETNNNLNTSSTFAEDNNNSVNR